MESVDATAYDFTKGKEQSKCKGKTKGKGKGKGGDKTEQTGVLASGSLGELFVNAMPLALVPRDGTARTFSQLSSKDRPVQSFSRMRKNLQLVWLKPRQLQRQSKHESERAPSDKLPPVELSQLCRRLSNFAQLTDPQRTRA